MNAKSCYFFKLRCLWIVLLWGVGLNVGWAVSMPPFTVTPSFIGDSSDFGEVAVGSTSSPPETLTITNNSGTDLSVQVNLTGDAQNFLLMSNSSPLSLLTIVNGGTETIEISCNPQRKGPLTADLILPLPINVTVNTYTFKCSGFSASYSATLNNGSNLPSGATISLEGKPNVPVSKTITITNNGDDSLTVDPNPPFPPTEFSGIFNSLSTLYSILPKDPDPHSVGLNIQCTPKDQLNYQATLTFKTNDPDWPLVNYPVNCKNLIPYYASKPEPTTPGNTIDFGYVPKEKTQPLAIQNTGNADLEITGHTIDPPGEFTVDNFSPIIAASSSANVQIRCTPKDDPMGEGTVSKAKLTLKTNALNYLNPSYDLTCQRPQASYDSTPAVNGTLSFSQGSYVVGQSYTLPIVIRNRKDSSLLVNFVNLSGSLDFKVTSAFPLTIPAGQFQPLQVAFTPTALGPREAKLQLKSNDPDHQNIEYVISGGASQFTGPAYNSIPEPGDIIKIGDVLLGNTKYATLTIQSLGTQTLEIGTPSLAMGSDDTFGIVDPDFPFKLPQGSQAVTLKCSPPDTGTYAATLTIPSNHQAQPSTHNYTLQCTGVNPNAPSLSQQATLYLTLEGQGGVTSSPTGLKCATGELDCRFSYPSLTEVVLTATPANGYLFSKWSGHSDCLDGKVILDKDKQCKAHFTQLSDALLTLTLKGQGKVTTSNGNTCEVAQCEQEYPINTTVALTATPAAGWQFQKWLGACSPAGKISLTANQECQAVFVEAPSSAVTLKIEKLGGGQGNVKGALAISCGDQCSHDYSVNTKEVLTAMPEAGFQFIKWSGDCQGTKSSVEVILNQAKTCQAQFEPVGQVPYAHYALTLTASGQGTVTGAAVQCANQCHESSYPVGTSVLVTAKPDEHSKFTAWGGDCSGLDNPLTIIMDKDKSCLATFEQLEVSVEKPTAYTVTILKNGDGTVVSDPVGIAITPDCQCSQMAAQYLENTAITLQATPAAGSKFTGFTGDPECVAGVITLQKNVTCTANFAVDTPVTPPPPPPVVETEVPPAVVEPPCPVEGDISVICNYQNQWQLTDVTVTEKGNISNLYLAGSIQNRGWISNAKLQPACTLTGGVLTGYIENGGLIKDVTFRGATLTGGTLAGRLVTLENEGGAIIQDVTLAPNAYLKGGNLQGSIEGDAQQPALLEYVTLLPGTTINNVMLGRGVKVGNEVTFGSGVIFQDGSLNTQVVNGEMDAQGHLLKDLTVTEGSQLSHATITGNVLNQGVIADATVQKDGYIRGGTLSGAIVNQGTLADIEFQGTQLTGGTLVGNVQNQGVLQDVQLAADTHVVGGTLAGEITGAGSSTRLDGVTIKGRVENVVLGKDVQNEGTLANVEFQGLSISGGTVAGTFQNTQGGMLQDVHLEANATIKGGNLTGNIIGDAQAPALLENLQITSDSYLEHVVIGEQVYLPKSTQLGPGVEFRYPPINQLPVVPKEPMYAYAIDAQGRMVISRSLFSYELITLEGPQTAGAMLSNEAAELVDLSVTIDVDPDQVGKRADILVTAVYKNAATGLSEDYMLGADQQWQPWDKDISKLQAIKTYQKLPKELTMPIFQGNLSQFSGEFIILTGYRLADEAMLVYSGRTPLNFFIDQAPGKCILYAVQDNGLNDSQLIKIDLSRMLTGLMQPLGPEYFGRDLEGISAHPSNPNVLYATAGDDSDVNGEEMDGYLYTIDRQTGELVVIGPTGFTQVTGLGTDPIYNVLWGWGEIKNNKEREWVGLIQIDPVTAQGTPIKQFSPKEAIGGLAVSPDGQKIYLSGGGTLWVYDRDTQEITLACSHITTGKIEGLDMQPNGILLLGIDLNQDATMTAFDPETCKVVKTRTYKNIPYNDIESLVWPAAECQNQSWLNRNLED